ncbi:hypothetical protein G9P44_000507 [Scheffersomyces stipitis]|nr:hypothetical protein G9P44_000507 [Scheffersomyces stipitis]
MSDLHKAFVKRIKDQERSLGLTSLSEKDEEEQEEEEDEDGDVLSGMTKFGSRPTIPTVHPLHPLPSSTRASTADQTTVDNYENFKRVHFKVTEKYTRADGILSISTYYKPPSSAKDPICIFLHGAGSTAMTFAFLSQSIGEISENTGLFLFDLRGHGNSSLTKDFSLDALVEDLHFILNEFIGKHNINSNPIYLVGHSLGGAISSSFLRKYQMQYPQVKGSVVLDIVEETAVKSLGAMPNFISNRPKSFSSLTNAIKWHMGFLLYNKASAEVSVPDLFDLESLTWKTDLALTQPFWSTWFDKLSENFLGFRGPKLLILSAHETLDKNLMIGQMQGKYQLVVFSNQQKYGHFIHEDLPRQVATCLLDFIKRNEDPDKFMKEELGIIPKWGGKIHHT